MTRNEISETQLLLDLANSRLEVTDKEQKLAELRYNSVSDSTTTTSSLPAMNFHHPSSVAHSVPDTPPSSSVPS